MIYSLLDPKFPQIPLVLQPIWMSELLQKTVFDGNLKSKELIIEKCTVGEKRYKPGKSFILLYLLSLHNIKTDEHYEQLLTAKLSKFGQGRTDFKQEQTQQYNIAPDKHCICYIAELEMIIWLFPYDRRLYHLPSLLDPERIKVYLNKQRCNFALDVAQSITPKQIKVLHYLPECSCMIRYQVPNENTYQDESPQWTMLYAKNYNDINGAVVFSNMQQLAKQLPESAIPLFYDADNRTLWQSHIPGKPLLWDMLDTAFAAKLILRIARCVARFHSCHVETTRYFGLADINEQLMYTVEFAAHIDSGFAKCLTSWIRTLVQQRENMNWQTGRMMPIHLDLKMRNFLLADKNIALIDLDSLHLGDPLLDIGSLIANFYLNGLRENCSIERINEIVSDFCHAYEEQVPWKVDYSELYWYVAAALIHEVLRRSLRQYDKQRMQHIDYYFALSQYYAALAQEEAPNVQ